MTGQQLNQVCQRGYIDGLHREEREVFPCAQKQEFYDNYYNSGLVERNKIEARMIDLASGIKPI